MRFQIRMLTLATAAAAFATSGCSGISDCGEEAEKCAAMLVANADKCAFNYQLTQGDSKRKHCEGAVKVVAKAKTKSAVPGLIAILRAEESGTPNDMHRSEAAKALAKIGDPTAVEALLEAIDLEAGSSADPRDKNTNRTNEAAAAALGELGDKKACGKLVSLMERSRYDYAVLKSIRALGELKCSESVKDVANVALKHDNKFMRKNAVIALGDIGDLSATDALIQMMFVEYQGVSFYREASFSLFQLGNGVADQLLATMDGKNEAVISYFQKRGGVQTTAVKAKCGFVLGDLRDKRAVQPLIEAFNEAAEKPDPVLLIYSAAPLGALGDKAAVVHLAKQMLDLDGSKRGPIMAALNQLGDRSVAPEMIEAMTVKHFVDSCVKLGYADKENCAKDKASIYTAVKAATDYASNLAGAEHAAAYQAVIDEMEEKPLKDYISERKVRLDANVECKADPQCWVKKLSDDSHLVREKAAWELGRLKDQSTAGALKKALQDKNTYVRAAVIAAYWDFNDKSAAPDIVKQLEEEAGQATFVKVNEDLKRLLVHLSR